MSVLPQTCSLGFREYFEVPMNSKGIKLAWLGQITEGYFYLGGRKVVVRPGSTIPEMVYPRDTKTCSEWILTSIKVMSFFTLILPLIMGMGKLVFRRVNSISVKISQREDIIASILEKLNSSTTEDIFRDKEIKVGRWSNFTCYDNHGRLWGVGLPIKDDETAGDEDKAATRTLLRGSFKGKPVYWSHELPHLTLNFKEAYPIVERYKKLVSW